MNFAFATLLCVHMHMIPIGYVQYHALKKRRNMFWVYQTAPYPRFVALGGRRRVHERQHWTETWFVAQRMAGSSVAPGRLPACCL